MIVVRMFGGGLFIYVLIVLICECVRFVNELVEKYGEVCYIILLIIFGLEYKVYVGLFVRKFFMVEVFVIFN